MHILRALLLLMATGLLWTATDTVLIQAGPWMSMQQDGSLRLSCELAGRLRTDQIGGFALYHQSPENADTEQWTLVPMAHELMPLQRGMRNATQVLSYTLAPDMIKVGTYKLHFNTVQSLLCHVREPIAQRAARGDMTTLNIMLACSYNYPDRQVIERSEEHTGQPIDAIILFGDYLANRVGAADWENHYPIYALSHEKEVMQSLFGKKGNFLNGIYFNGLLGFPSAEDPKRVNESIHRDRSIWQVFLQPRAQWDLGLVRSHNYHDLSPLRLLLASCLRRRVPLIMGAGHSAGFISEPLSVELDLDALYAELAYQRRYITRLEYKEGLRQVKMTGVDIRSILRDGGALSDSDVEVLNEIFPRYREMRRFNADTGGIVARSGGTRYVLASMGGGTITGIPRQVTMPLFNPAVSIIQADAEAMKLWVIPFEEDDSQEAFSLHYDRIHDDRPVSGVGWGVGEGDDLVNQWFETEKFDAGLVDRLTWMVFGELERAAFNADNIYALLNKANEDKQSQLFARRLTNLNYLIVGEWVMQSTNVSNEIKRDWLLRRFGQERHYRTREFEQLVRLTEDEQFMSALLFQMDQMDTANYAHILDLLMYRLEQQMSGRVQLDQDERIQHVLCDRIFGSFSADAKRLLPLVEKLLPQLSPLARKPVIRFWEQHLDERSLKLMLERTLDPVVLAALSDVYLAKPQEQGNWHRWWNERLQLQLGKRLAWDNRAGSKLLLERVMDSRFISENDLQRLATRVVRAQKSYSDLFVLEPYLDHE